ncbi:putative SNAP25 homologous protein SNAP30 [Sesamum alatum]|uniref:SNAP25 homologous protein SNAP30 n=1 Tax=Sesamum alatum TaxID=300844 RepID=A0AAE1YHF0_9LAMI|nr:putative SNAP25 homologous protein SNAP30 [Sesamum alatum]
MFGFRKSPAEQPEDDKKNTAAPARRSSSEPALGLPDDPEDYFGKAPPKNKQKKDFDSMSVQELEGYAVNQAEETTKSVNNCLKIAEDIRQDATRTLDTLHEQGEQIHRTHVMAANMDRDLSKGEKLLNNLGGMFSMPWKPKKTKTITGPQSRDDNDRGKRGTAEEREKLGLGSKGKGGSRTPPPEPTNALQKIDVEKSKQDDGLADLSDILGELKGMAVDMGTELDRQNKALDDLQEDVDELNSRVKGANRRAQKLIDK